MPRQTLPSWGMEANSKLQGLFPQFPFTLKHHKQGQLVSNCPYCADPSGEDRFVVFEEGNFWCRVCHEKGFWDQDRISPEEAAANKLVKEQERLKLKAQIATCNDWQTFHAQVNLGMALWQAHGIDQSDVLKWGLGYCPQAPCTENPTPSLTIPIFHKQRLVDIRHRLVNPPASGQKYRSHWPNLPPAFFNLDAVSEGGVVYVVEGEKKAIVLEHYGLHPVISFPGLNFGKSLLHILSQESSQSQRILFIPDPGSDDQLFPIWRELAKMRKVGVIDLTRKPDDFVMRYGIDPLLSAVGYPRIIQ